MRLVRWFTIYIAACGLLGFCVARDRAPFRIFGGGGAPPSCLPLRGLFDDIASNCPVPGVDWFWLAAVGVPRQFISGAAMTALIVRDMLRGRWHDSGALVIFAVPAAIYAAALVFAWRHWPPRTRWLGTATGALTVLDIGLCLAELHG